MFDGVFNMKKEKGTCKPCKSCEEKMADSFVESIEEEIRNENWQIIWNKYGKVITYAASAVIIGVAVYSMWQRQDLADKEAISSRFTLVQNMIMSGDLNKAIPQIKALSTVSKKDYANLAKLEYAAVLREKNDKEALVQYKALFSDPKVNSIVSELAYILYVNASIDIMPAKEILLNIDGFIKELSEKYSKGHWSLIAKESLAFCYIKLGKNDLAKEALESLVKTTGVPNDMAERAKIILQSINK